MHGLHTGATMRRISLVGIFTLVMLALATHVTVAQAATNTITQTAITSPSDPAYFYDASDGATDPTSTAPPSSQNTAGFTVTGTTNSTDTADDMVDIDCYDDNGSQPDSYLAYDSSDNKYDLTAYDVATLVTVPVNADGSFSAFVPYYAVEDDSYQYDGACRLRAVPAGTTPTDGLSSFAGPRVLVSVLGLGYSFGNGSVLDSYSLESPELGAINQFGDANDCGLDMSLASTSYFSESNPDTFACSDAYNDYAGTLTVDGQNAYGPNQEDYANTVSLSVSATENSSNGDLTISEVEPLDFESCAGGDYDCTYTSSGVVDDRTIQEASQGRVVLVTDTFKSADGQSHQVVDDIGSSVQLDNDNLGGDGDILFQFPGQDGYQAYSSSDSIDVGAAPGTIYAYNDNDPDGSTSEGRAAITFYTTPSGDVTFPSDASDSGAAYAPVIPYSLNLSAGGSSSISLAYATEFSQSSFAGDLASELNMPIPPSISISSPSGNSTTHSSSATVTGVVTAPAGVESVVVNGVTASVSGGSFTASVPLTAGSDTISATVTSDNGQIAATSETLTYDPSSTTPGVTPSLSSEYSPVLGPIAVTGSAKHAGLRKETLNGKVTAGSAGVSYYFAYGKGTRYGQRTKTMQIGAGSSARSVALTANGLIKGARYHYRLVVTSAGSTANGLSRSFEAAR
jgi:hypothetical protein